eukprot:2853434-Amphidinium_carterae.1
MVKKYLSLRVASVGRMTCASLRCAPINALEFVAARAARPLMHLPDSAPHRQSGVLQHSHQGPLGRREAAMAAQPGKRRLRLYWDGTLPGQCRQRTSSRRSQTLAI